MYQKMSGDQENQEIIPVAILSDVHEKLGNTYVPCNDLESPYFTNKKKFTITYTQMNKIHINKT